MRTKLAALITATAVAIAPVSVAHAQDISSEISDTVEDFTTESSQGAESLEVPTSSQNGDGTSSLPTFGLGDSPEQNFLLDVVVSLGIWAVVGSIYGAVIAPHIPQVNIYDMLPFLRG
ncbi:family 17 glucosidase [Corynebacterium sp. L4756]|uniref:family 17 glucosidase n=1 Tax=unclassified Corynebacterium TaxID=2624378 RepID=UPI00374C9EBB